MRVKGLESSLQSHAVINSYTKSIAFVYPEKKHVEVQKVLYEDNDGRVIVKEGLNNGENSIKR